MMRSAIKFGILAGLFFGVGFWYAKLSSPKAPRLKTEQADASDDLSAKEAEYEKIQQRIKLSYYKELTAEPRKASFEAESPQPPAQTQAQAAVTPEPKVAEAEPEPEPKTPDIEEKKPSSDRLAKALEKVLGKEAPDAVSSAAKTKLPVATGSPFAVQVASLPDRKAAEELVNRLTLKGYPARLVQAEIAGRGMVYRVRIHGYQNRGEADNARSKIATQEKLDAITVAQ